MLQPLHGGGLDRYVRWEARQRRALLEGKAQRWRQREEQKRKSRKKDRQDPGKERSAAAGESTQKGARKLHAATADRSALVGDDKRETSAEAARASSSSGGASEVDDMAM